MHRTRPPVWLALRALVLAVTVLAALPAAAQKATAKARPAGAALPRPDLEEWSLANGLDVVYLGVHKAPVVAVQVWYHAGSKDEPRDRRGSAHMFEHMMFKGTRNVPPEEHMRHIDRVGGDSNAGTTEDMTFYTNTVPRDYLDFAVRLEAERMRNLLFRKSMIDTEREVLKEEIRQRYENDPVAKALVRFRDLVFTRHPYAWLPGGYIEDLERTTPEDLKRFYDAYYVPNNATLIVVGDVTEAQVREAAERWMAPIARGAEPPRPARQSPEPPQTERRRLVVDPAQIGIVFAGFRTPEARSDDLHALNVLGSILADGESSRLNQRLVRKDRIAWAADLFLWPLEDPGLLVVLAAYLAPEQGDKIEAAVLDEIARLRDRPVSARELDKARNQLAAQFVFGLEDVEGLAMQIGYSKIQRGDARAWLDDYAKVLAVTPADVQRVARTYLVPEKLTLVVVPPAGAAAAGGGR